MKRLCYIVLTCMIAVSCVWPQTTTASLEGFVKDASGAAVVGASVRVANTGTNSATDLKTDQEGHFFAPILPPGNYSVVVEAQGFKKTERSNIRLDVDQDARIEIALAVGSIAETVTVIAQTQLLDASTSSIGHVLNDKGIEDLPLNGRNPLSLIMLVPGMAGQVGSNQGVYGDNFSVNGGRPASGDVLLDGVRDSVPSDASLRIVFYPSVDAVEEFRVQTSNYSAEFGFSGGGIVNMIYKSGTNQLHGTAYDFLRNSVMDANSFYGNKSGTRLASFKRNQFGGSLGGPVVLPKILNGKDKFFFFIDYEGLRQASPTSLQTTVPTLAQRTGDFSNVRNTAGQVITIYNPFSTTMAGSNYTRTPVAGNIIPASLINPVSANVTKYWPDPNQPGNLYTQANNYYASGASVTDVDQFDVKGDLNITDRQRVSLRGSWRLTNQPVAIFFPSAIEAAQNSDGTTYPSTNDVLNYTFTVSPTFITNLRAGYSRVVKKNLLIDTSFDPTKIGLPAYVRGEADELLFPGFSPSGYYSLGSAGQSVGLLGLDAQVYQVANTKVTSHHTIKFGLEWALYNNDTLQVQAPTGVFSFSQSFTQGPNPLAATSAGDGFATFLFGTPSAGDTVKNYRATSTRSSYYAPYINDDWKLSSKLTANIGLRWDVNVPQYERYNRANYFDPTIPNPLGAQIGIPNLQGGLVFYGVGGAPRRASSTEWTDFAPRLGLAYQWNEKTVIRAAYGIFFAPPSTIAGSSLGVVGFSQTTNIVSSLNGGVTPGSTLDNPYPQGYLPITGSALGINTSLGSTVTAQLYGIRNPYIQNWNFGIQRSLPAGITIDAAYVGAKGTYLVAGSSGYSLNQLNPQYLSLGTALTQQVNNPFYGFISTGSESSKTVARYQLLLPYPQFTGVGAQFVTGSNSIYHSFQLKAEKRLSNGLNFLLAYTFGKSIDDGSVNNGNFTGGAVANNGYQNVYNRAGERAVSPFDISQHLVISFVYNLPFGRGRMLGGGWNRAIDGALGGWQFNGIATYQGGVPLELSANIPVSGGVYGATLRPNSNGQDAALSGAVVDRLNEYFNVKDFSIPATFTFGNVSRTVPNVRAPGVDNYDLSLFKNFKPWERLTLELRLESFNAFNHPQFGAPGLNINSVTFGQISSQANSPRNTQVAMKLIF